MTVGFRVSEGESQSIQSALDQNQMHSEEVLLCIIQRRWILQVWGVLKLKGSTIFKLGKKTKILSMR